MPVTVPTQLRLPPDTLEQLDLIAREHGCLRTDGRPNRSQAVRDVIRREAEKISRKRGRKD